MTRRDAARIGVFGAFWGLVEITLGAILKGFRVPMSGAVLSAVAVVIALTGRYFVKARGAILMMGAVAGILKIFSIGTVIASPFLAILAEAVIAELVVAVVGLNAPGCLLSGVFVVTYTALHPLLSQGILFGADIYTISLETVRRFTELFHIPFRNLVWIFAGYASLHILLGMAAGWLGWIMPRRVALRLKILRHSREIEP